MQSILVKCGLDVLDGHLIMSGEEMMSGVRYPQQEEMEKGPQSSMNKALVINIKAESQCPLSSKF